MGKGRKIGVTLLCCAAAAALLSGLGMLLLPHEARGAAHGATEECAVVDCRASVPEQVSATGDVLLLSPETAAQLGGEACGWLYGDRMVFFAGMTGAEVETCTSAPRTIRAAESGAVAGTGLLLGSEGYCYLTLYGTETEDLERLARRAWAFAAVCVPGGRERRDLPSGAAGCAGGDAGARKKRRAARHAGLDAVQHQPGRAIGQSYAP